jgi:hypothetical protein
MDEVEAEVLEVVAIEVLEVLEVVVVAVLFELRRTAAAPAIRITTIITTTTIALPIANKDLEGALISQLRNTQSYLRMN